MNEDSESAISDDLEIPNIQHPPHPSVNQASYAPAAQCGLVYGAAKYMHSHT
jgi:vancomycin permeability regulator SanA